MWHRVAVRRAGFGALLALVTLGCAAPPAQERPSGGGSEPSAQARGPQRLVMGLSLIHI